MKLSKIAATAAAPGVPADRPYGMIRSGTRLFKLSDVEDYLRERAAQRVGR